MRWVENVELMDELRRVYIILVGHPRQRDCSEEPGLYVRTIFERIIKKGDRSMCTR